MLWMKSILLWAKTGMSTLAWKRTIKLKPVLIADWAFWEALTDHRLRTFETSWILHGRHEEFSYSCGVWQGAFTVRIYVHDSLSCKLFLYAVVNIKSILSQDEGWIVNTGMKENHSDVLLKHIEKCWQITVFTQMRQVKSFIDNMRISVTRVGNLTWSLYCKDICSQQIEVENVSLSCCEHQKLSYSDRGLDRRRCFEREP